MFFGEIIVFAWLDLRSMENRIQYSVLAVYDLPSNQGILAWISIVVVFVPGSNYLKLYPQPQIFLSIDWEIDSCGVERWAKS